MTCAGADEFVINIQNVSLRPRNPCLVNYMAQVADIFRMTLCVPNTLEKSRLLTNAVVNLLNDVFTSFWNFSCKLVEKLTVDAIGNLQ